MFLRNIHLRRDKRWARAGLALPLSLFVQMFASGCGQQVRQTEITKQAVQRTSQVSVHVDQKSIVVSTPVAEFEVLPNGYLRASLNSGQQKLTLDDPEQGTSSDAEHVVVSGKEVRDFALDIAHAQVSEFSNASGLAGKRVEFSGHSASLSSLEKRVTLEVSDDFPALAVARTRYRNTGASAIQLEAVAAQQHRFSSALQDPSLPPFDMWAFHGASEKWGLDEVIHLTKAFTRKNPMQQVIPGSPGTGGGIPVVAFWNAQVGEAIGHLEKTPEILSIPVKVKEDQRVHARLELHPDMAFAPGSEYSTPSTFVAIFQGDFFQPLRMYSQAMSTRGGWQLPKSPTSAYKPNWCGWGYALNFTAAQMTETIPKLKELGIEWATLDAGWFDVRGDWQPRKDLRGEGIESIVDKFHKQGLKLTLWWIPIVVEDGKGIDILDNRPYKTAEIVKQHPDWLILNKDGSHARMTSDMAGLCPAVPAVREYYKRLTEKFIRDWDFDGHKLDFSYAVPPCYNPAHHHASPEDSTRAIGEIYRIIFDTTRALKPEGVTMSCSCGTLPNVAWLPYLNQSVTADPTSSVQVRRRIKIYKALLGPNAAVYGDHVELTKVNGANTAHEHDNGRDFASTIGTGGVPGTKFTWPDHGKKFRDVNLTPEKEALWKKWLKLYNDRMLSRGTFLNLYVYGYDTPEAYVIEKDGNFYYAFFAPEASPDWKGTVQLRGLKKARYRIKDYEDNSSLGSLDSQNANLSVHFREHLLLEASPE